MDGFYAARGLVTQIARIAQIFLQRSACGFYLNILLFKKKVVFLHREINFIPMCSFNITVDEDKLLRDYPGVDGQRFGQWLQRWVDDIVMDDVTASTGQVSPNSHSYEEVKEDIRNRIDRIEAGKATFYPNEEVFSSIRERYAL